MTRAKRVLLFLFGFVVLFLAFALLTTLLDRPVQQEEGELFPVLSSSELTEPEMLPRLAEYYADNPDLVGWLRLEGTHVDYPVVRGKDNDYYLEHDFYGNASALGTLFIDADSQPEPEGTNWIIYGHTTVSGTMFGDLKLYKDEAYYLEHPTFTFDTLNGEGTYEIISVVLSQVFRQSDEVFKYYKYVSIDTREEFEEYVGNVAELSLYDTGKTARYGDSLLTLSTCDYYTENGRLAIVARKID